MERNQNSSKKITISILFFSTIFLNDNPAFKKNWRVEEKSHSWFTVFSIHCYHTKITILRMITYQSLLHTRVRKSVKILRRAKKIREIYYLSSASPKIKISKSYQFLCRHESNGWWREDLITNRMLGTKNNPFLCHSRYNTSRRYDSKWTEMRSSSWYPPYVRFKYNNCALFSRGVDRTAIYQALSLIHIWRCRRRG